MTATDAALSRIRELGPIIVAGNQARLERKGLLRHVAETRLLSQAHIAQAAGVSRQYVTKVAAKPPPEAPAHQTTMVESTIECFRDGCPLAEIEDWADPFTAAELRLIIPAAEAAGVDENHLADLRAAFAAREDDLA